MPFTITQTNLRLLTVAEMFSVMEIAQKCLRNRVACKFFLLMQSHTCHRLQRSNNLPQQTRSNSSHPLLDHSRFRFYRQRPRRSCLKLSGRSPLAHLKQKVNKVSQLLNQNGHHSNCQEVSNLLAHNLIRDKQQSRQECHHFTLK